MDNICSTKIALAHSLKSLMKRKPFGKIHIEEICKGASVSRRSFYRHFSDKYELLIFIHYYDFSQFLCTEENFTILDYLPLICSQLVQDRLFYIEAFKVEGPNSFRDYIIERLTPLILRDFKDVFDDENSSRFWIKLMCEGMSDACLSWLQEDPPQSVESFLNHLRKNLQTVCGKMSKLANLEPVYPALWTVSKN